MTAQRRDRSIATTPAEVDEWDFRRNSALRTVAHADEARDGS